MRCLVCGPRREGRVVFGPVTDGAPRRCACGQWWQTRFEGNAPAGFRGQWSGWVEWPISNRRARKLQAR